MTALLVYYRQNGGRRWGGGGGGRGEGGGADNFAVQRNLSWFPCMWLDTLWTSLQQLDKSCLYVAAREDSLRFPGSPLLQLRYSDR